MASAEENDSGVDPILSFSNDAVTTTEHHHFKSYKQRWCILAVVSFLNFSNAMNWIGFSPVADHTAIFYHLHSSEYVNYLSLVFPIATVPFGIIASWMLDTYGLRSSILVSSWFNAIGSLIKVISTLSSLPSSLQLPIVIIGQSVTSISQPFVMFASTKVAAVWFEENHRALANVISSMANPLGVLAGSALAPLIVNKAEDIPLLLEIFLVPAILVALSATFGVRSSVPPTPPSASAEEESEPFIIGLKHVVRNVPFLILALAFGIGLGIFTTLSSLIEEMLCPWGYSDVFAGLCGAMLIACGVVGAAIAGVFVDKTKKFEEIAKISYSLSACAGIVFALVSRYQDQEVLIAISLCVFGFMGFAMYPVCLELGVECTFPVDEGTSSGIQIVLGQIVAIVLMVTFPNVAPKLSISENPNSKDEVCGGTIPQDYRILNLSMAGLACFGALFFTALFKCQYKRLHAEEEVAAEEHLDSQALK